MTGKQEGGRMSPELRKDHIPFPIALDGIRTVVDAVRGGHDQDICLPISQVISQLQERWTAAGAEKLDKSALRTTIRESRIVEIVDMPADTDAAPGKGISVDSAIVLHVLFEGARVHTAKTGLKSRVPWGRLAQSLKPLFQQIGEQELSDATLPDAKDQASISEKNEKDRKKLTPELLESTYLALRLIAPGDLVPLPLFRNAGDMHGRDEFFGNGELVGEVLAVGCWLEESKRMQAMYRSSGIPMPEAQLFLQRVEESLQERKIFIQNHLQREPVLNAIALVTKYMLARGMPDFSGFADRMRSVPESPGESTRNRR